jgi:hypothetical protein
MIRLFSKPTLTYLLLTLRHKYFVFKYGLRLKVPIVSLIVHDYTKLYPHNLISYGRQFFGDQGDPVGFAYTWNHHQKRHRHHWEYWIMITGHNRGGFGDGHILDMPDKYIREMVADWLAASRVYSNNEVTSLREWSWLHQNFSSMRLSDYTRTRVLDLLNFYFEEYYENFNIEKKE